MFNTRHFNPRQFARRYFPKVGSESLNTDNKKASVIGIDLPFLRVFLTPDATIGSDDMQNLLMKYSEIPFGSSGGSLVPRLMLMGVG